MKKTIAVLAVIILLLTACSTNTNENTFVRATLQPESLDIAKTTTGVTFELMVDIYSGIYYVDKDGNLKLDSAESVNISDDGLVYTVKLKEGLKWVDNNGEEKGEVTAKDYIETYKRVLTPETGAQMAYLFDGIIKGASEMLNGEDGFDQVGIKEIDDYTFSIELNYPAPYFESMLAFPIFYPQSQEAIELYGEDYALDETKTWYNGAYYTSQWDPEYEVLVNKSQLFWDSENVEVESVAFRNMPDLDSAQVAFKSGDVDYFTTSDENLYSDGIGKYSANDSLVAHSNYIALNYEGEFTSDKDLREALYYGFNRDDITKGFSGDVNKPHEILIPKGVTQSSYNNIEYRDFAEESYGSYDLDKANEALENYMVKKSIDDPSEISLDFVASNDTSSKKIAESLQAEYKSSLGISINTVLVPNPQFREMRKNGEFDLILSAWGPDYADPSTYINTFKSINVGSVNDSRYQNEQFDLEIENVASIINTEDRMSEYAKLEKFIIEDEMVVIPFYQKNDPYFVSDEFKVYRHLFFKVSDRNTEYLGS